MYFSEILSANSLDSVLPDLLLVDVIYLLTHIKKNYMSHITQFAEFNFYDIYILKKLRFVEIPAQDGRESRATEISSQNYTYF